MLESIKRIISPPYSPKDLLQIFITVWIIFLIPLTVLAVFKSSELSNKAKAASPIAIGVSAYTNHISSEPKGLTYVYKYIIPGGTNIVPNYINTAYQYNFKPVLIVYTNYDTTTPDWATWDATMNAIKADGREVWVVVEPDLMGYIRNNNACGTTGKTYTDRFLSTKPANAHLGFFISGWNLGSGTESWASTPAQDAASWKSCWLAAGGDKMEDVYFDISDRDQEYKGTFPWPASRITMWENFARELKGQFGKKVGIWQIPMGNTTCQNGRRSNIVETWLTVAKLNELSPYVDKLLFGPGIEDYDPANTQSWNLPSHTKYDCGLFNQRVTELAGDTNPPQTAPVVSSVSATSTTDAATITWTTDQPSTSKVDYGTTASFGKSLSSASLVTSHTMSLTNLAANTTYYYKVYSTNSSGLTGSSGTLSFSTKALPSPTAPVVSNVTAVPTTGSAAITWTTDQQSTSKVDYGTTTNLGTISNTTTLVTSHSVTLANLNSNTTYYYKVSSTNASGLTGSSGILSFKTAAPTTPTTYSFEAETMSLNRNYGRTFSDTNASAGKALIIWSNATASKSINTSATKITIRARGDICSGSPHMTVKVGSTTIFSTNVSSATWADYSGTVSITSGARTLKVIFDNDYYPGSCDRNLRADKITLTK
ncbi:MAG: hypothetical protein A2172_02020 [Candidatus Woykebacteria bacterium RBG_13_40_15]|uniref:Fibronectin type-III domain-containing protein n=1 Tax=Candidatus Woykebacteria bacterium RBG_13_40_15 TaxID=1802593 RepID=A0A1G1W6B6_9BACT|nr:MAG: hypothetical protein A2172_02020 [Candidatus Woykebacteria bacterium RBG_13_40_15]